MSKLRRVQQVIKYGWQHAGAISKNESKNRVSIFFDIMSCYMHYDMWSNQYLKERFWELDNGKREEVGKRYGEANRVREGWVKENYENWKFTEKWSSLHWETSPELQEKRKKAYMERYGIGEGLIVQYGVQLHREHYLPGTISIGKHVLLAKNVFIDYSGEVIIEDNVKITAGVSIESHHRDLEAYEQGKDVNIPTKLHICEGAYVGTHAIILDSCNYIGKHARIGAGAVVVKDIPDYSVAVGVPAKVVKTLPHYEEQ